jgi:hypothetical protein
MTDMTKKTDHRIWTGDKKAFILRIFNIRGCYPIFQFKRFNKSRGDKMKNSTNLPEQNTAAALAGLIDSLGFVTEALGNSIEKTLDEDEPGYISPSAICGLHNLLSGILCTAQEHYAQCVVTLKDE